MVNQELLRLVGTFGWGRWLRMNSGYTLDMRFVKALVLGLPV